MKLIPVIDLMGGVAVHARRGQRAAYRPLQSGLCPSSSPLAVVDGLLGLHPFHTLYVADLDAIQGHGDHCTALEEIRRRFPALELWVDAGVRTERELNEWIFRDLGRPVLGSECLPDEALLRSIAEKPPRYAPLLSLDFMGTTFNGSPAVLENPARWPRQVIVMSLGRVGSDQGPDLPLVAQIRSLAPARQLFAAGGVREPADLDQLAALGVSGVLLASALHEGRIGRADLTTYA